MNLYHACPIFPNFASSPTSVLTMLPYSGIISSLAFSLSSPTSFYAAGTLSPTLSPIALYDASVDEAVMYLGIGDSERRRVSGGVTQVCHHLARRVRIPLLDLQCVELVATLQPHETTYAVRLIPTVWQYLCVGSEGQECGWRTVV